MSFLNASLIIGTLAALVPVLLHLIGKREPKKVVFPSIRFLTKRFESNRSRIRVRRWWLLAMRILAVAAFAIALARPTIHRSLSLTWLTISLAVLAAVVLLILATLTWLKSKSSEHGPTRLTSLSLMSVAGILLIASAAWAGWTYATGKRPSLDTTSPVAIAIVIDNGQTFGWKTDEDDRKNRVIDAASALISQLPSTSRICIVDRSSNPPAFSLDVAGALSKLEKIHPIALARPLDSRINAAVKLLDTSELENHQLMIITDLAKQNWKTINPQDEEKKTLAFKSDLGISLFDLGEFHGVNRSLSIPKLADASPTKMSPSRCPLF